MQPEVNIALNPNVIVLDTVCLISVIRVLGTEGWPQ